MAGKTGGSCDKARHKKDSGAAFGATRKNKERRAKTHANRMVKLERKQERQIAKLVEKLKTKGVEWIRKEGRRRSMEIKYLKGKIDVIVIK